MEQLDRLDRIFKLGERAFAVFHEAAIPARQVCHVIAQHLGASVEIAELRSDHISAEDGRFVQEALTNGKTLLLIATQGGELPQQLFRAWDRVCQSPQRTGAHAGRQIHFTPPIAQESLGRLGLVVPAYYRLDSESFQELRFRDPEELGAPTISYPEPRMLGLAPVSLSMKALCFLHHRDEATARHHESVSALMQGGSDPITWTDLQRLLRAQPNHEMLDILAANAEVGRIKPEQLEVAAEAIAFLRREQQDERIGGRTLYPSIYHALWEWTPFEDLDYVFRGQGNSRWPQESTLLRANKDGIAPTIADVVERTQRTQSFLDKLEASEQRLGWTCNEDERLAIAQHYGMPTPLLDYTRSLSVAAFFATGAGNASHVRAGELGIIYYIAPDAVIAALDESNTQSGIDFARAAGLRVGRLTFIEPNLPDPENRIARQQALFVDGFASRDLQRLVSGAFYFRHQAGEAFEDPVRGVTRERLLTPNAELQRLADSITSSPPRLTSGLAKVPLSGDDIFGSLGLSLRANLHWGQKFLDELARQSDSVEAELWPRLRAVIANHLDEAQIASRTVDFSAPSNLVSRVGQSGINHVLDDVNLALGELERLAGLESDVLRRHLARHRPLAQERNPPVTDACSLPVATPKARIALALGLFLIGLEYLRTVRGSIARQYIQNAYITLHELS